MSEDFYTRLEQELQDCADERVNKIYNRILWGAAWAAYSIFYLVDKHL